MTENSTMDPRKLITGSNVIQIARAITEQRPLWTIIKMAEQEKKTRILKNTLRRPVLDPMTPMPENITDMGVLTSMLPGSSIFIEKTTLYDICIENYSKNPNYYKEVFEFLL